MGFFSKLFGKSNKNNAAEVKENNLKIGIVIGSVREGRNAQSVANWMYDFATNRNDVNVEYELVDLKNYPLPMLGANVTDSNGEDAIKAWSNKMASYDGYIFVVPEYNHAIGGALKNALDYLNPELNNNAAGFVGYGSTGGTRAHEHLR